MRTGKIERPSHHNTDSLSCRIGLMNEYYIVHCTWIVCSFQEEQVIMEQHHQPFRSPVQPPDASSNAANKKEKNRKRKATLPPLPNSDRLFCPVVPRFCNYFSSNTSTLSPTQAVQKLPTRNIRVHADHEHHHQIMCVSFLTRTAVTS